MHTSWCFALYILFCAKFSISVQEISAVVYIQSQSSTIDHASLQTTFHQVLWSHIICVIETKCFADISQKWAWRVRVNRSDRKRVQLWRGLKSIECLHRGCYTIRHCTVRESAILQSSQVWSLLLCIIGRVLTKWIGEWVVTKVNESDEIDIRKT